MKRKCLHCLVVVFLLLFGANMQAQDLNFKPSMGVGVHGGVNFSKVSFVKANYDTNVHYGALQLFSSGLFVKLMAEENAGLQIEFNLSKKGWTESRDSVLDYSREMQYYEIPVLTHLAFGKKRFKYILNIGPYIAFHQDFTENLEFFSGNNIVSVSDSNSYYGKVVDAPVDFGFIADAGLGYRAPFGEVQLKARYSYGMANIFNKYPESNFRNSGLRNIYISFAYCYNFTFKEK